MNRKSIQIGQHQIGLLDNPCYIIVEAGVNHNGSFAMAFDLVKGGIINFTRYLAAYYGPHQIRVNCVSPGGIFNHQPKQFVKNYEKKFH